jgi:DNA mismatch endonuclease, patch repair protein
MPGSTKKVKRHVAMLVDTSFWHACPQQANMPANNRAFWRKKLTANKARDLVVNKTLRQTGWRVVRIWEHELTKNPQQCVEKIKTVLGVNNDI